MSRRADPAATAAKRVLSTQLDVATSLELPLSPVVEGEQPYDQARVLVRVSGEPIGFATVALRPAPPSPATLVAAIQRDVGASLDAELARQGLADLHSLVDGGFDRESEPRTEPPETTVTVVVCTRNRAATLRGCLDSLGRLESGAVDFVIVDNAPSDEATRELVEHLRARDARFRYVREPRPGLSCARNCGLAAAGGEIVAFTDDDVRVDGLWIHGVLRGFGRRPDVACVTGLVASASLELPSEQYFDARVTWSSSCVAQVFDADRCAHGRGLFPYAAGQFGTGANVAFRTDALRDTGGFDEALGAGSACAGGEDLDIFVRMLRAGHSIAYEPAALVWHEHRASDDELRGQMYAYGKGLSAYLFKYACSRRTAWDVLRRAPFGLMRLASLGQRASSAGERASCGRGLLIAEARGWLAGPFAYLTARRRQDPANARAVAP